MKVILFCGGRGTRFGSAVGEVPKPMLSIGYRPILWHLMKYYASFGHKDFILCLGYRADVIKNYFLHYDETVSNDFVLRGGREVELLSRDIDDWNITFVDSGPRASIGERLKSAEPYVAGEEYFLANYSDGLTDLDLDRYVEHVRQQDKTLGFLAVQPSLTFHVVSTDDDECVQAVTPMNESDIWINAGFFVCKKDVFRYLGPGEDLVGPAFTRLLEARELMAYRYRGFWKAMDTIRDKQELEDLWVGGHAPWAVSKCV
ncbi:MAG: glucose-1-phosphate cytidylyltransferase [Thermoleophilia bacterium]|nr:glucose-1-phosphate cytidylyltransferase [Thermoleophilia bacterium]